MSDQERRPDCYGDLETVFPEGDDGLRHTPTGCFDCPHKTDCLRTAMARPSGLAAREKYVDRAYESGMMGFWERWSRKKALQRRRRDLKRGKKAE